MPWKLLVVLSPVQVARISKVSPNRMHRTMLIVLYATGVRRDRTMSLKISDIAGQRRGLARTRSLPSAFSHKSFGSRVKRIVRRRGVSGDSHRLKACAALYRCTARQIFPVTSPRLKTSAFGVAEISSGPRPTFMRDRREV